MSTGKRPSAYIGRFAPSPSGPLHDGSLVAAMASWVDARAHHGKWLLRIEDIDTPRVVADADRTIMRQLQSLGMQWDDEPVWQSARRHLYQAAFDTLMRKGMVYGCACTRQEIRDALAFDHLKSTGAASVSERPYPGTCRAGITEGRRPRSWRFRVPDIIETFDDRWMGPQHQHLPTEAGDFILKRADGLWAYQLAVVVDDGLQGVTDVVRGADLLSSTARQRALARALGQACPRVMHVPLVLDAAGNKLSKQNHAPALDCEAPIATLNRAWQRLGFLPIAADNIGSFWSTAIEAWARRFPITSA